MSEVISYWLFIGNTGARHTLQRIKVAGRTCRYLWTVRAAIPWYVKIILGLAMGIKCLPTDFLIDETLTLIAVWILSKVRPGLVRACVRAAELRA